MISLVAQAGLRSLRIFRMQGILGLLVLCAAFTLLMLLALGGAAFLLLMHTEFFTTGWLETLSDSIGTTLAVVIAWFLFPVLLPLVSGLFVERVAGRIEQQDYHRQGADPALITYLIDDARFALKALLLNLLCLPLYLIPLVNVTAYYVLNSHLLGREYLVMALRRHLSREETRQALSVHRVTIWLAGLIIAVLSTLPVCNIIAPFLAIALATHLTQSLIANP